MAIVERHKAELERTAGPQDRAPSVPRPHPAGGGNGLVLLARLSSSWGVASDEGTCVWFERALLPPDRA